MSEPSKTDEFLALYAAGQRRIYAYIRAQVLSSADADDVLQDATTVLWRKFEQYQPGSDFVRWACRVARLEVLAYHRHRRRLRTIFSDEVVDAVAETVLELSETAAARAEALDDCVELLPPRDRTLLNMKYQSAQSVKQIASAIGRTESAVYKALQRIHEELFDCVEGKLERSDRP
jgi:RNA polymerase sigma-70 factor, ECF subfamily